MPLNNVCGWCATEIQTMAFKGTGACCENHRKILDGETALGTDATVTKDEYGVTLQMKLKLTPEDQKHFRRKYE